MVHSFLQILANLEEILSTILHIQYILEREEIRIDLEAIR